MKNVLLIGDSIRMGYDKSVKASLQGIANVVFPPENCRFASYLLRYLHEYKNTLLPNADVDVLHWNAGLWDCLRMFGEDPHTPIDVYAYYIDRLCVRIKTLFPNAKVIFATSTSVQSEKMGGIFKRYNEDIEKYNQVAVEVVKKYGFEVNDLYPLSTSLPEDAHSDSVHFYTSQGTKAFTEQVLKHLANALDLQEVPIYQEDLYVNKPIGI